MSRLIAGPFYKDLLEFVEGDGQEKTDGQEWDVAQWRKRDALSGFLASQKPKLRRLSTGGSHAMLVLMLLK